VSPLMSGNVEIPYARRKQELDAFLVENEVAKEDVDRFMQDVVGPWATQNAIAHMMADDYERMNRDVNITERPYTNDYDQMIQQRAVKEQHQSEVGQKITEMIKDRATPAEIINFVINSFPELKVKFLEVCARTENYQFYEHAQMVLGQYLALLAQDQTRQEDRVIPIDTVVKAIIFHDIEKENSKSQYTDYPTKKGKKGKGERHDKEGEHKLSVDMMRRYEHLWASGKAVDLATSLVDADPFGFYLRRMIEANDAFMFIVRMARKQGIPDAKIKNFFYEYHQYYQADFSSYTSASTYETSSGDQNEGKETSLGKYLKKTPDGGLEMNPESRSFEYSDVQLYKDRFAALEKMFASTEVIVQKFDELAAAEQQLEAHKNKRRFAEPVG
jgi:hypothetical protein